MKHHILCIVTATLWCGLTEGLTQVKDSVTSDGWKHEVAVNLYLFQDPFIFLPTYKADNKRIHVEVRYNYEDLETVSAWVGYNFSGGRKLSFVITPMFGGLVGRTDALAGGIEVGLDYNRFSLYTESEYVTDVAEKTNDFYYNWTDLTFQPGNNFYFGLSIQRTRLYQSDLELQKGLLTGYVFRRFDFAAYLYNIATADSFLIISVALAL